MKLKPITAIVVLLLVVASLLVAGCTTSTTSNTNQTPSTTPSTETHNATLENYLAAYKSNVYGDKNTNVNAWNLKWVNSTSASLEWTVLNKTLNGTFNHVETFLIFPTTQDATNYLNAMNKTAYSLASTIYPAGGAYQNVTGHAPTVYIDYKWNEGNPFNISEYKAHEIFQIDNIIVIHTGKQIG